MMRIALDSSALAKRYVSESGTPRVLELCAQATEVVVSVLCVPEILSGLNRRLSSGAEAHCFQAFYGTTEVPPHR